MPHQKPANNLDDGNHPNPEYFSGSRIILFGTISNGTRVILDNGKSVAVKKGTIIKYSGSWIAVGKGKQEND